MHCLLEKPYRLEGLGIKQCKGWHLRGARQFRVAYRSGHPDALRVVARECPLRGYLRPKRSLVSRLGHRKILEDGTSGRREPFPHA